ncbi:MAG: glycosyltransferase [Endomicrobium sp.]|jgi:glycosyltransferase involved in cell wall biosynthesis|nr:glycosyltransferase [Endomicrobium sp.]
MNSPKVSVIIPVYNTEKYLRQCLDSVVNQTLKDIELICINDGSTDNSLKILNEYASSDNRIKLISLIDNKGVSFTRNFGIRVSKGRYIGFVDSDDWIDLNFYENLYLTAEKENSDIVAASTIVNVKQNKKSPWNWNKGNEDEKERRLFFISYSWFKIYRRDFLIDNGIFFQEVKIFSDLSFTFISSMLAKNITISQKGQYFYRNKRISSCSDAADLDRSPFILFDCHNKIYEVIKATNALNDTDKENYLKLAKFFAFTNLEKWTHKIKKEYKNEYFLKFKAYFSTLSFETNPYFDKNNSFVCQAITISHTYKEYTKFVVHGNINKMLGILVSAFMFNRSKRVFVRNFFCVHGFLGVVVLCLKKFKKFLIFKLRME